MATKHLDSASRLGGVLISNQVVAELLEQLRNGIWQDTDHLPPELELANRLNVSRTVVRDALSELERAGYIERVRGIGTVINRDVVNLARRMDQKFEFTQMIRARGMQPNSDDLRVSRHTADADAAQALNISLDTPVYYICRRVLADNTPVLFSTISCHARCSAPPAPMALTSPAPFSIFWMKRAEFRFPAPLPIYAPPWGTPPCAMPWPCSVIRPCWN